MTERFDIKKHSCSDAKIQYSSLVEARKEVSKWYLRRKTELILSLPIPMSYENWSALHKYLEDFE